MQVSRREFKTHLSQYIEQAQSGQSIELTSYRKVMARLVGIPATESTRAARLAVQSDGKGSKPVGADFKLHPVGKSMSRSLSDLKEIYCKFAWTAHISPLSWSIEQLLTCETSKICPRPAKFWLRFFKSDRLLARVLEDRG